MEGEKCSQTDGEILLPIELLMHIFQNLNGKEVYKCRRVCKLWKDAADLLILVESRWQKFFEKEYGKMYYQAPKKSSLTYEDLYKSISLWSKIASANVKVRRLLIGEHMVNFQVINKDIIGVSHCRDCQDHHPSALCAGCDSIGYFDLKTGKQLRTQVMDGEAFLDYKENEHFVVVVKRHWDAYILIILPKNNPGTNIHLFTTSGTYKRIFLHENALYYPDASDCQIHCVTVNKKGKISNNVICHTSGIKKYFMRLFIKPNELHNFRKYNFSGSCRIFIKQVECWGGLCFTYGDIILYGSPDGRLYIFYAPLANGPFDIFNNAPTVLLNLKELVEFSQHPSISCIDVIEVENGHDIIVMTKRDIVIITLSHASK